MTQLQTVKVEIQAKAALFRSQEQWRIAPRPFVKPANILRTTEQKCWLLAYPAVK